MSHYHSANKIPEATVPSAGNTRATKEQSVLLLIGYACDMRLFSQSLSEAIENAISNAEGVEVLTYMFSMLLLGDGGACPVRDKRSAR